jgi:hypothetical protein
MQLDICYTQKSRGIDRFFLNFSRYRQGQNLWLMAVTGRTCPAQKRALAKAERRAMTEKWHILFMIALSSDGAAS